MLCLPTADTFPDPKEAAKACPALGFRSWPKLHGQSWECTEPQRSESGSVLTRQTPQHRVWRRSPATTEQERHGMEPLQALFSLSPVATETVPHAGAGCGRRTRVCLLSGGFRSGSRRIGEEPGVSGRQGSIQAPAAGCLYVAFETVWAAGSSLPSRRRFVWKVVDTCQR